MAAAYNATAVMNERGEREFSFAFITDITKRKQAEAEVLQALEREKELSEQVALCVHDLARVPHSARRDHVLDRAAQRLRGSAAARGED
jgi:hypothetical protein